MFSQLCPTLCDPHGQQHARLPCPSPSPRSCPNSMSIELVMPSTVSSPVVPFSSYLLSFPASGSFLMSRLLASDDQSIGASASVLLMNIQDRFLLGLTGLISLQSKGLSSVFSNTTVQKHQFFGAIQSMEFSRPKILKWVAFLFSMGSSQPRD